MDRHNLLLLTSDFPYGNKGDNMFLRHEIDRLSRAFGRVEILSTSEDSEIAQDLPSNVTAHRLPLKKMRFGALCAALFSLCSYRALKELFFALKHFDAGIKEILTGIAKYFYAYFVLKKEIARLTDGDTIVYNYWLSSRAYAAARLKNQGKLKNKTIARCHGFDCYADRGYLPFRREIVADTDEIYFISEHGKNYFREKFIPLSTGTDVKLRVARLGLNSGGIYTEPVKAAALRLVSCSNIVPVKRLDRIIDALAAVDCKIFWTHIGVGTADYDAKVRNYARQKLSAKPNIEYEFAGFLSPQTIRDKYASGAFDLLINTSESEGIPVSMMEAYSCSLPIIGLDVGGVGEIVPEESGLLLAANASAERIGQAITDYAQSDTEYRGRKKREALEIFERKYGRSNPSDFARAISQSSVCVVTASFDQFEYANVDVTDDYGNVVFLPLYRPLKSIIAKAARLLWYRAKLPFKSVWYSPRFKSKTPYQDSIVVFDSLLGTEVFPYLARRSAAELHCWFWNIVGDKAEKLDRIKKYATVWSFDRDDCARYGLEYNHQFYGEVMTPDKLPDEPCVIFVGRNKDRYRDLLALADYLESEKIAYGFYVFDRKLVSERKNIKILKRFMPYKEVLSIIEKATCLVDFVQSGQTGLTLRTLEALSRGRQVLTNNPTVKTEAFNRENIFVTEGGYDGLAEFLMRGPEESKQSMASYGFADWVERFRRRK